MPQWSATEIASGRHRDGRGGTDLLDLIRPALVVPVHFDDYGVFKSPRSDFLTAAARRGYKERIRTVERGETISLVPQPIDA